LKSLNGRGRALLWSKKLQGIADYCLKTLQIGSTILVQAVSLLNSLGILHGRLDKFPAITQSEPDQERPQSRMRWMLKRDEQARLFASSRIKPQPRHQA
jgi:hypothetical protein